MTARNFGMTSRATAGASQSPGSLRGDTLPRLPSNSILAPSWPVEASSSPLKRSRLAQAGIDVIAVGFALLLICSIAAAIGLSFFWLFFVRY